LFVISSPCCFVVNYGNQFLFAKEQKMENQIAELKKELAALQVQLKTH